VASSRPSWDEYFMRISLEVARRSTCLRRKVGAILVSEKRILATGYNGPPRGLKHCDEVGCVREQQKVPTGMRQELCRGLHAEMNAFLQAASHGVSIEGASLYSTTHPCILCVKMLINAGIERVVIGSDYEDDLAKEMLREAGIKTELLTLTPLEESDRPE